MSSKFVNDYAEKNCRSLNEGIINKISDVNRKVFVDGEDISKYIFSLTSNKEELGEELDNLLKDRKIKKKINPSIEFDFLLNHFTPSNMDHTYTVEDLNHMYFLNVEFWLLKKAFPKDGNKYDKFMQSIRALMLLIFLRWPELESWLSRS